MKKIYLAETDKKVAGVCGGIAEAFDVDSTLIRLIFLVLAIATGIFPAVIGYIIAWAVIPHRPAGKIGDQTPA